MLSLGQIAQKLLKQHRKTHRPPPKTAFEWVLWENVTYLANDAQRGKAFALLKKSVGTKPLQILRAPMAKLLLVSQHGVLAPLFARKMRDAAEIAYDKFDGDVTAGLSKDSAKAVRQLKVFPGIAEPGADKILVALGRMRALPMDSNALRVLERVGYGESAAKSYTAEYRSVKAAVPIGKLTSKQLFDAYLVLQRHGREICRRTRPLCSQCSLRASCAYAARSLKS